MYIDKTHNTYLEWLVSGGIIGFIAFLSFLSAPFYYVFNQVKHIGDLYRQSAIIGVLFGYSIINLFYFDTISSSLCFIAVLAFIHSQCSAPLAKLQLQKKYIVGIVMPILIVFTGFTINRLTLPSLFAAHEAIVGGNITDIRSQYIWMHQALDRHGIGSLEILNKMNSIVLNLLADKEVSMEEKSFVSQQMVADLKEHLKDFPGDIKAYYNLSQLYMMINDIEHAKSTLAKVDLISPRREYTDMLRGTLEYGLGHLEEASGYFKKSLCLKLSATLFAQIKNKEPIQAAQG